jgi:hypothetical protein
MVWTYRSCLERGDARAAAVRYRLLPPLRNIVRRAYLLRQLPIDARPSIYQRWKEEGRKKSKTTSHRGAGL